MHHSPRDELSLMWWYLIWILYTLYLIAVRTRLSLHSIHGWEVVMFKLQKSYRRKPVIRSFINLIFFFSISIKVDACFSIVIGNLSLRPIFESLCFWIWLCTAYSLFSPQIEVCWQVQVKSILMVHHEHQKLRGIWIDQASHDQVLFDDTYDPNSDPFVSVEVHFTFLFTLKHECFLLLFSSKVCFPCSSYKFTRKWCHNPETF